VAPPPRPRRPAAVARPAARVRRCRPSSAAAAAYAAPARPVRSRGTGQPAGQQRVEDPLAGERVDERQRVTGQQDPPAGWRGRTLDSGRWWLTSRSALHARQQLGQAIMQLLPAARGFARSAGSSIPKPTFALPSPPRTTRRRRPVARREHDDLLGLPGRRGRVPPDGHRRRCAGCVRGRAAGGRRRSPRPRPPRPAPRLAVQDDPVRALLQPPHRVPLQHRPAHRASTSRRRTARAARRSPGGASRRPPPCRPGRRCAGRCTGTRSASTWRGPSRASSSSACGAMPSPQALSRGKSLRSRSSTRAPGRVRSADMAAAEPAGPAPTITTSHTVTGCRSCPIPARPAGPACCPASARPVTASSSATTWGPCGTGRRCRTTATAPSSWPTCTP
jgi:hypothetical protein